MFPIRPGKAISQYTHDSWGLEDGLPQVSVNSVIQTRDGYLWLATEEGFARFDGVRFEVYDKKKVPQLLNNVTTKLYEDRDGSLWVGTLGGGVTHMKEGKFTTYTTSEGLAHLNVSDILRDRQGNLWVGTDGGLNLLENEQF